MLTIVAGFAITGLALLTGFRLTTPTAIFLLIIAYAAFRSGLVSALVCVGLPILYFACDMFTSNGLMLLPENDLQRVVVLSLSGPAMALMISKLKSRAEVALLGKLKQEQEYSVTLKAILAKQRQAEDEVRRLNAALEERVKERTAQLQQSEEFLKKQQQQIQAILDNSTAGIYLKDAGGRYLLVNRQTEKFFGLDQTAVVGKTDQELFPTNETTQWNANDQQVLATGQGLEIEEEIWQAGELYTILSIKFPVLDENGKIYAVGGISTDITERKRLEREAQKFVSLVENSNDFIGFANLQGQLEYLNEAGLKLLGLESLQQIQGRPTRDLFPPQDQALPTLEDFMSIGHLTGEFNFRHFQTGEAIPTYSNKFVVKDRKTGQPLGVANISYDLRERKRAEAAVRSSQARLSAIIESAMDAIITLNADYQIVAFNHAAEKLLACPVSEVLGQSLDRFIPERFRVAHSGYIASYSQTGNTTRAMGVLDPLYALRADGQEFPIEATISQAESEGQKFYTVFIRDVTERVHAYQLLEQRVARRTAELSVLLEISQSVAADLNLYSIRQLLLEQLQKLMKFRTLNLYRYYDREGTFSLIDGFTVLSLADLHKYATRLNASALHLEAVRTKKPIIIDDFAHDPPPDLAQILHQFKVNLNLIRSAMFIPLMVKEEVVGLMVLSYQEPCYYTTYHTQLAQAVGYQLAIAIENAHLYEQAQHVAALEERQRLARELHDSTSQVLYSIQLGSRALRNFLQGGQVTEAAETVEYIISLAKGGLDEMRALIFELRPESLAREGLLGALQKQIIALKARYNLQVEAHFSQQTEPDLPLEYKEALYRIAREALHNVVKHANTDRLELHLAWNTQEVRLIVKDYGRGFNPTDQFPGHFGLHTMQERTQKLPGGQLSIESKPGEGTTVCLSAPVPGGVALSS